jgi:hypothetical protein
MATTIPGQNTILSGSFTATGQSSSSGFIGKANVWLYGTSPVGTVKLERSPDQGTTWIDVSADTLGTGASYALNSTEVSFMVEEIETAVLWRFNCTAYTSGTINYRLSQ